MLRHLKQAAKWLSHQFLSWTVISFASGITLGAAMTFAGIVDIGAAKTLLAIGVVILVLRTCFDGEVRRKHPVQRTLIIVALLFGGTLIVAVGTWWFDSRRPKPSFVYIFPGGPYVNNLWTFYPIQRGPESVLNIQVTFADLGFSDRQPSQDEIRRSIIIFSWPEIDVGTMTAGRTLTFAWPPITPDHQKYMISISYRGGYLIESLRVERVGEKWAYAMTVGTNSGIGLLNCRDPEFPSEPGLKQKLDSCRPEFARYDSFKQP
jgi:hypothetical protein